MHPDDTLPDRAVRIPLRARDGSIRAYTLVDAGIAEWANQWRWHLHDGHAGRNGHLGGRRIRILLHREILGLTYGDKLEGDHINRDKLDNRRSNVRVVPHNGQKQNVPSRPGSSSKFRGVDLFKRTGRWRASVTVNRVVHHLGYFSTEIEAAEVARVARLRLMLYAVD
jgi:hypothetical protein